MKNRKLSFKTSKMRCAHWQATKMRKKLDLTRATLFKRLLANLNKRTERSSRIK